MACNPMWGAPRESDQYGETSEGTIEMSLAVLAVTHTHTWIPDEGEVGDRRTIRATDPQARPSSYLHVSIHQLALLQPLCSRG